MSENGSADGVDIEVDPDRCQHYGQCAMEAPELFRIDAAGELEYQSSADAGQSADAEAAAQVCPMQAITLRPPARG